MARTDSNNLEQKFPIFHRTSNYLQSKANFFKNSLPPLFAHNYNYDLAERVCKTGLHASSNNWNEYFKNVDNLIDLSIDFLKLQVQLEKTGKYPYSSFKEVQENVYSKDKHKGPNYLWGLYFSEVFWKIHHSLVNFFIEDFVNRVQENGSVLEVPSGTAFFLSEFLRRNQTWKGIGIDLADSAIDISKKILQDNNIPIESYKIIKEDFFRYGEDNKFDRVICGEFLEHVEDPPSVLRKINRILKNDGKVFLTAAVWAGGIDHIYLYTHPQEVRNQIYEAGFSIEKELVQAVFERDKENPEKGRIPVSFATILSKVSS
jgi:2-polyprenyl-3-methyl-5-hydroxy-6-metoxy-1,4-benzoquinol methylase